MGKLYHQLKQFLGLNNLLNPRDIGNYQSKAQNVSIDKHGMIRTIGGLETYYEQDGVTALTQAAVLAPGSGLFQYGSDHWRGGSETIIDLLSQANAASDHDADDDGPDAVTGWTDGATVTTTSVADTDGASIASNGTSFILKHTLSSTFGAVRQDSITTVTGQTYILSVDLYCLDASAIYMYLDNMGSPVDTFYTAWRTAASWANYTIVFVAQSTNVDVNIGIEGANGQIAYSDDIYLTKIPRRDLDTNWLALADVANAQVDLYNVNDDSFTAALMDFGTASSYIATIDKINFPTTSTITDANSEFLSQGIQAGDIRKISGSALNNIVIVVERVTAGTIYVRGTPLTVDADDDGTVTLTKYNPTAFHYVNEALRASPVGGGIAVRPKHYSFADRTHFEGADSSERKFANWYANDVGPVAPTDIAFDDAVDSGLSGDLTAGAGWEVGMAETADDGDWAVGTYILACSFIYDDGQESALYVPSTDVAMTAVTEGASLTLCAKADTATNYDERISGGRVYCRLDETDDPWSLLLDISMAKGARATLSGTYNAWAEGATADDVYTASFVSKRLNIDSYESLAGIDPTMDVEVFNGNNAFWDTSVIARNRCFIGSVRYTAEGGALSHFRDRILYSTAGAFDTFPIGNYIDVVQGDAEDYVKLGAYGNDLLCFKASTLYIIDISDPDPAGWQMKQDVNKGKYPFRGIQHLGAYFETPHGPGWCNKFGVFLYTGNEIVELLKDKIELSEHPLAYQRYVEFDGSNDYVTKSNDADLNFGANTDFSLEVVCRIATTPTAADRLLEKGSGAAGTQARYLLYLNAAGTVVARVDDGTTTVDSTSTTDITDGEWHHPITTHDRDGTQSIYVDAGAAEDTDSITAVGDIDNAAYSLAIGIGANDLSSNPLTADIALVRIWNRVLSAAEVLALYNGQPVLAADQWGSQTELLANGGFETGGTGGDFNGGAEVDDGATDIFTSWSNQNTGTGKIEATATKHGGSYAVKFTTGDDPNIRMFQNEADATNAGKKMRLSIWTRGDGTYAGRYRIYDVTNAANIVAETTTGVTGATYALFTREFDVPSTCEQVRIYLVGNATNGAICYFDDVSLTQIGCVAEWAPKGIGDAQWDDESGNALHATVAGATAIFEDSWAKFFTDYSIMGYHARTNQLIIMRDCTGNWSSGQDYGDVFIIDLDTGAITTGRRVFTKGVPYTNFITDHNQDLVIAEQDGANVDFYKWTDEPQSQAVGLIDIRTADFDFGNPAFKKEFDAFIAYYKSLAAQTNPISYAVDGDDRHTAWTRITGNMDAEGFWEKLTAEPTPFGADSIRLKIDNPTAATTIELNDLSIRRREIPLDIS